jgi:hypothetical protein
MTMLVRHRLAIRGQLYLKLLHSSIDRWVAPFSAKNQIKGKCFNMSSHSPAETEVAQVEITESTGGDLAAPQAVNPVFINQKSTLQDGEVIRVELYEEVPSIQTEIVVREKVQVRKVAFQQPADS